MRSWVRVLYVPAKGEPEFREIGNDLNTLAGLIGQGELQAVKVSDDIIMFCDASLPSAQTMYNFSVNGHFIHGDAFFVRRVGQRVVSLTDADVSTIIELAQ